MSSSNPRPGLRRNRRDIQSAPLAQWDVDGSWPAVPQSLADQLADARRAGYEEGYQAGRNEERADHQQGVEADRRRVRAALMEAAESVARDREQMMAEVTNQAVSLAIDLAQALLNRELNSDQADSEAVARALELAPSGGDLLIRLHPEHTVEVAGIERAVPGARVTVVADQAIERGGCVVEVGSCRIDTQVGPALARARALIASAPESDEQAVAS